MLIAITSRSRYCHVSDDARESSVNIIDTLVAEHQLVEQVLNCLEMMTEQAAQQKSLDAGLVSDAVTLLRTFVHGWHFPREEAYVRAAMGPENLSQAQDLQFHDHERCCECLRRMEEAATASAAGDPRAARRFVEAAQVYECTLMKHVEDEEDRIFPAIKRTLTAEKELEAVRALRHAESQVADNSEYDLCIAAAGRLADRFNVTIGRWRRFP